MAPAASSFGGHVLAITGQRSSALFVCVCGQKVPFHDNEVIDWVGKPCLVSEKGLVSIG